MMVDECSNGSAFQWRATVVAAFVCFYQYKSFLISLFVPLSVALIGPFISLMPSIPIFADRHNKQTIIYSKKTGESFYNCI